jgi:hypothetical protein
MLAKSYPYYLANKAVFANEDLIVNEATRLDNWIQEAIAGGADLLCGRIKYAI